jgi:hypothetical protein
MTSKLGDEKLSIVLKNMHFLKTKLISEDFSQKLIHTYLHFHRIYSELYEHTVCIN